MDSRLLTEDGWKDVLKKSPTLKDNGLQKTLAAYEQLDDKEHADRLKIMGSVKQLASNLQKAKEIATLAAKDKTAVLNYLKQVIGAADAEQREIAKAKVLAEKTQALAAKTEAKKKDAGEEDEEEETGQADLKTALQGIKTAKKPYYFLYCDAKPFGVIISRKDIRKSVPHKKELAKLAGGVTRAPRFGEVRYDGGKLVFEMEKAPAGAARILQKLIKTSTGLGFKVMVGAESAEDEEEQGDKAPAKAVPPPTLDKGTLAKAPEVWHGTRKILDTNIRQLQKAILQEYGSEHPKLLSRIEKGMSKLDSILDKLDTKLADSLAKANAARDDGERKAELQKSTGIHVDYL